MVVGRVVGEESRCVLIWDIEPDPAHRGRHPQGSSQPNEVAFDPLAGVWHEYVYVVGVGDVLHAVQVACGGAGDHRACAAVKDRCTVSVDVGKRSGERGVDAWQYSLPSALLT
ncbi:MAG TPA: hypothetical protein VK895_10535 [Jiangellaceae bacterium]|nr:hypothetical protein [Jiangellaceae bacterium]